VHGAMLRRRDERSLHVRVDVAPEEVRPCHGAASARTWFEVASVGYLARRAGI